MSFLVSEIFTQATALTADTTTRWDVTAKLPWYNNAVRRIRSDRPESRYDGDSGNLVTYADATAAGDTSILDDSWKEALAFFVAAMCLMQDAEDKRDLSRSKEYMDRFEDLLKR